MKGERGEGEREREGERESLAALPWRGSPRGSSSRRGSRRHAAPAGRAAPRRARRAGPPRCWTGERAWRDRRRTSPAGTRPGHVRGASTARPRSRPPAREQPPAGALLASECGTTPQPPRSGCLKAERRPRGGRDRVRHRAPPPAPLPRRAGEDGAEVWRDGFGEPAHPHPWRATQLEHLPDTAEIQPRHSRDTAESCFELSTPRTRTGSARLRRGVREASEKVPSKFAGRAACWPGHRARKGLGEV